MIDLEKNKKTIIELIIFTVVIIFAFKNIEALWSFITYIIKIFMPFIIGVMIAFVLNVLLNVVENKLFKKLNEKNGKVWKKIKRPTSLITTFIIIIALIAFILGLLIPQLKNTATIFTEKEVQDPPKTISITEQRPDYDIEVDELIERSKDKTVNMYRSVSGGNRGEIAYTIRGDEVCSGFHFQDGTKWGTGFSDNVPLMTDKAWPASFLDANNNLRTDLTFSEIAKAISNGELSEEVLNDMTLQIGNKGWVYASELFDGVTKEVEVGTKVIEGGSHIEMVPEVVTRTRTITEVVKNQRAIDALNVLGRGADILGKADTVHNVAEIVRPTSSNLSSNKKADRKYDYDDSEYYV